MNRRLCVSSRFSRLLFVARLISVLICIPFLSINGVALAQDTDSDAGSVQASDPDSAPAQGCRQNMSGMTGDQPILVSMEEIEKNPEDYYGKRVTVEGEMHRI